MEKIPAANIMAWSIELDKGLRSKDPNRPAAAIQEFGPRLRLLSSEANITKGVADMYGLVMGEDRLFANSIFLRLINEFVRGNDRLRASIVKVFLFEARELSKEGRNYNGLLSKRRMPNWMVLLQRVKIVYDEGGCKTKSLALRLFGCMADFAKDSAQIRYLVLLSLNSASDLEMKAAIFAAGCICRLSEDFSHIFLEVLVNIVSSTRFSSGVILGGIRVFAAMQSTHVISCNALKVGKKLILSTIKDEFKAELLSSLTRLTVRSSILSVEQADLLLSILRQDYSSTLKITALQCLCLIFNRGYCHVRVSQDVICILLDIIEDANSSQNYHGEAIRVLHKIFSAKKYPHVNLIDIYRLVRTLATRVQMELKEISVLCLHIMVNILCNFKGELDKLSAEYFESVLIVLASSGDAVPVFLAGHVITSIINHLVFLASEEISNDEVSNVQGIVSLDERKKEIKNFFSLILQLVRTYSSAGITAIDKVKDLIISLGRIGGLPTDSVQMNDAESSKVSRSSTCDKDPLINLHDKTPFTVPCPERFEIVNATSVVATLILSTVRFTIACLTILHEHRTDITDPYPVLKLLIVSMQQHASCHCNSYEFLMLCMHIEMTERTQKVITVPHENDECCIQSHLSLDSPLLWVCRELAAVRLAERLEGKKDYWAIYRSAKHFCLNGLWFAAAYAFRKIRDAVQSETFRCWIAFLLRLSGSETELKLLFYPEAGLQLVHAVRKQGSCDEEIGDAGTMDDNNAATCSDFLSSELKFLKIYDNVCSAETILTSNIASDHAYHFQIWFMNFRTMLLATVARMLRILNACKDLKIDSKSGEVNTDVLFTVTRENFGGLMVGLADCSKRLLQLTERYDLLATLLMDIDPQSFKFISRLACNCSLLALCSVFSLDIFLSVADENIWPCELRKNSFLMSTGGIVLISRTNALQDLVHRLKYLDSTTSSLLRKLFYGLPDETNVMKSRTQIDCSSGGEIDFVVLCQLAISTLLRLQEEARSPRDEEHVPLLFNHGLQFLCDLWLRSMQFHYQLPRCFFSIRPCVGAVLFAHGTKQRSDDEISVLSGFQLSLNLCIQLKNVNKRLLSRITLLYCILAVKQSDTVDKNGEMRDFQVPGDFEADKTSEMVALNDRLLNYIKGKGSSTKKTKMTHKDDLVTAYVRFKPSDKGRGFSNCLLDVSSFPEGSYQMKWHCCSLDENGCYWSLLPLNPGAVFSVRSR